MLLIEIILRMYLKDQKVESRCLFHKSYESQVFCFAKKGKCLSCFIIMFYDLCYKLVSLGLTRNCSQIRTVRTCHL